jgi:hypothetical protein
MQRETELKIQNENRGHYESWLVWMRIVMKPEGLAHFKTSDPTISTLKDKDDIRKFAKDRLAEFYYSSLLYSPDYVVKAMREFLNDPNEANFMKTAIAMRKDLWKKETKANLDTLSLSNLLEVWGLTDELDNLAKKYLERLKLINC